MPKGFPKSATRGKAQATSQIGAKQHVILDWLLTREQEIQAKGTEEEKLLFEARGVPWDVKKLCKAQPSLYKKDGTPDTTRVSESLRKLEDRGLVQRFGKGRTTRAKLTEIGRGVAQNRRDDPRSSLERREEAKARRRIPAIEYDLAAYEANMSAQFGKSHNEELSSTYEIGLTARLLYYYYVIKKYGQLTQSDEIRLKELTASLKASRFRPLLPDILSGQNHTEEQKVEMLYVANLLT